MRTLTQTGAVTGQALVVASIILAVTWMLILAGQTMRPLPPKGSKHFEQKRHDI